MADVIVGDNCLSGSHLQAEKIPEAPGWGLMTIEFFWEALLFRQRISGTPMSSTQNDYATVAYARPLHQYGSSSWNTQVLSTR